MAWKWRKSGLQLPEPIWDEFEQRVDRLYGPVNKGRRKWLYALAFRLLLRLDDDSIKTLSHQLEAEELGLPGNGARDKDAADLLAAASKSPRRGKAS